MKLRELAHCRTGDKGDVSNLCVIAYRAGDYARIALSLSAERVQAHLAHLVDGPVQRHELPQLAALNFVMHGALAGGVTRSLALDAHGKCLSYALMDLSIDEAPAGAPAR